MIQSCDWLILNVIQSCDWSIFTNIRFKLQELVPYLQTVIVVQTSLGQDSLKQDSGVVVFVEMREIVEVGQDVLAVVTKLPQTKIEYPGGEE